MAALRLSLPAPRVGPAHLQTAASRRPQRLSRVSPRAMVNFPSFPGFGGGGAKSSAKRDQLKEELLRLSKEVRRGVTAKEEEKAEVERLASQLEALNPTKKPLASPLTTGKWELNYTTSESILGMKKPPPFRPSGPIYQSLDVDLLKASNQETWPFFNEVYADLQPEGTKKVKVQFKTFKIFGLIPVQAPETARGELTITYLDDDLRISRGDKGNLFVLSLVDRKPVLMK